MNRSRVAVLLAVLATSLGLSLFAVFRAPPVHKYGASSFFANPIGSAGGALIGTYPNPGVDAAAIGVGPCDAGFVWGSFDGGMGCVGGPDLPEFRTVTTAYTVDSSGRDDVIYCNFTDNANLVLPAPTVGRLLRIIGGPCAQWAHVRIAPHASEKVAYGAVLILAANAGAYDLVSDGTDWFVASSTAGSTVPGLTLWLRASLGVTNSSGVTTWVDQSGTGDANKTVTASGTAKPTLNASNSSFNNLPTIDFNGTTNYLVSGTWGTALAQPFTAFVVGDTPLNAAVHIALDNLAAHQTSMQATLNNPAVYAGTGLASTAAAVFASPMIFGAIFNGTSSQLFTNQLTGQTPANAGTNNMTGTTIGGYGAAPGNTTNSWAGSIAEIQIYYTGGLNAGDPDTVMSCLSTRYAIALGP